MKYLTKSWLFHACNLCISLSNIMHWTKMSLLLFGEQKYPEKSE